MFGIIMMPRLSVNDEKTDRFSTPTLSTRLIYQVKAHLPELITLTGLAIDRHNPLTDIPKDGIGFGAQYTSLNFEPLWASCWERSRSS